MESTRAYLMVGVSFLACACAVLSLGYFVSLTLNERALVVSDAAQLAQALTKNTKASSSHALERETKDDREKIAALVTGKDAIAVIRMLEDTGSVVGSPVSVDSVSVDSPKSPADPSAISLTVHSEGTFAHLLTLLTLLEHLPIPARVLSFDLGQASTIQQATGGVSGTAAGTGAWRIVARVRAFATIDQ